MKRIIFINFFILPGILLFSILNVAAQGGPPPPNQFTEDKNRRPGLLEMLGLTPDQVRQIRQLNKTLQPMRQEAQRRFAIANRALDEAIYADEVNEELINQRMKEAQLAQAELIKSKTMMETSVRKILTQEQLIKFRELRERAKQNQPNPEGPPPDRPNQRPLLRKGIRKPV
ncbi:MAG: periplasmic heavy metal sensor [Pyrinomonadaceae bacterium]|nr:periplasmic heavy metal sensor [Pyrinomonadaceae bacterium]